MMTQELGDGLSSGRWYLPFLVVDEDIK